MGRFNSINSQEFVAHLDTYMAKLATKIKNNSSLQVLVHSEKLGTSFDYAFGGKNEPFHIASIGKVFTATLIFILTERGRLNLDAPIVNYIPASKLKNLFLFKGVDYSHQVTIKDLVGHTSGIADYFEDSVIKRIPFIKDVISNDKTLWTPDMLLDFSRDSQKAVGKPGAVFHYSDTGYILLGKIIENVTKKSFHENLHNEFFSPLGMNDSYLMFYSEPANVPEKPIQKIWVNNTEISSFTSLSCDWSGGGIVSTTSDLLKFYMALRNGKLITKATLSSMETFHHKFRTGIHYGLGMMEIHFEDFFFMLKGLPRVTGHIGILSTHMFYDKTTDTYIIMNFGSTSHMVNSFKALIEIVNSIKRIKTEEIFRSTD